MRKFIVAALVALTFTGCVTDGMYNGFVKPAYKAGRTIVQEIPIDADTREKLIKIDKYATTYDEARGVFVIEYESGKLDVNTSEVSGE